MKITILGAGVIGVTTAYELARQNQHDITVIDSADGVATEASAVNASMIAPGHAYAWASPKVPGILLKSIYRNDQAFRIRLRLDLQFWRWTAQFLKQCNNADARQNTVRKHALCVYSQECLGETVADNAIEYDRVQQGLLYLFRNSATLQHGVINSKLLAERGQKTETLTTDEVIDLEPAYKDQKSKIAGALYCPTDETGNSQKFTESVFQSCVDRNVQFLFNTKVDSLVAEKNRVRAIRTSAGDLEADLVVVSLGAYTPLLLNTVGIRLPIYPVKGYSLTFPIRAENQPPKIGTIDEDNLVALAPIGDSLRATATAEFAGYDLSYKPKDFQSMFTALKGLLPNGADFESPMYRTCLRPMTPQGTPYIGFSKYENLFVNSGQGHMGWTMACGSARIAADLIAGNEPKIDVKGFALT